MKPFDMSSFKFFDTDEPVEPPKKSDLIRNADRGGRFQAGGQEWEITHGRIAPNAHIIKKAGFHDTGDVYYAAWDNGVITISPVAKRGAFRPVGKALVKEKLDGLGALPKTGRISLATARKALKLLPPGRKACGITAQSLRDGMEVEREHRDVTKLGLKKTALIAAAHLCEARGYYPELKKMERKLKRRK
jgi:hypothetical protein